jgi:hypothetical protein
MQAHFLPQDLHFHENAIVLGSLDALRIAYHDVYIDNFLTIAQCPHQQCTLTALLHSIDAVFNNTPNPTRRVAISESKLDKGDTCYSTNKRLLGWDIDTHQMQLSLPQHQFNSMATLFRHGISVKCTSKRKWSKLLGVLRSSSPAIYGASHLFSILQHAMTCKATRIRITPLLRLVLRYWLHVLQDTHVSTTTTYFSYDNGCVPAWHGRSIVIANTRGDPTLCMAFRVSPNNQCLTRLHAKPHRYFNH